MSELEPADVDWSRRHFALLAVGGIWGIPRSGIVFTKTDEQTLVLSERMPHMPGMPLTPGELEAYQNIEYELVAEHFRAAGVNVSRDDR